MELFAFITLVMMLLYLVAITFPIPYTPLEVFQFALRFLFLLTALLMVCGTFLNKEHEQGPVLRVDDWELFFYFFNSSFLEI